MNRIPSPGLLAGLVLGSVAAPGGISFIHALPQAALLP
jgi:hypothetical protein